MSVLSPSKQPCIRQLGIEKDIVTSSRQEMTAIIEDFGISTGVSPILEDKRHAVAKDYDYAFFFYFF